MNRSNITLNRNLKARWCCEALRLAAYGADPVTAVNQLETIIRSDITGAQSIIKSMRYLRKIWLDSSGDLLQLRDDAIQCFRQRPTDECACTLSFFKLLATYPFVREVAEVCGRLIRLQGSVKSEQIKRRIVETYGEREPVIRSARYTVSILADLGVLVAGSHRGVYTAGALPIYPDTSFSAFCLNALLLSMPSRSHFRRTDLSTHPAIFAIDVHSLLNSALTDSRFSISRESFSEELVSLR